VNGGAAEEPRERAPVAEVRLLWSRWSSLTSRAAGGRPHQRGHGARENNLIVLACGVYGNVLRFLVSLTASDAIVKEGVDILERSLLEVAARRVA
jgi:hypothetical protein